MRGLVDDEEERFALAQASLLTRLVRHLGRDADAWLDAAFHPLAETFRITAHRSDREWTIQQVKALGATAIDWMPKDSAFVMPFPRGKAAGDAQRMMAILHETGRITRQEAASMLPVRCFQENGELLALDLCAAPGSKTTQLGEQLHPHGVVVANEPNSGRLNMLVSNRSRLGLANIVVTQHDGRHFARVPPPGFDVVLADVPCTGTATTRKNPEVWHTWSPQDGRKMFSLQVDIATRGASLLVPGGTLIYSTCSIDPIENEAVVAEILRRCPYLELIPIHIDGLVVHSGLSSWPYLNQEGAPVDAKDALGLPFMKPHHLSPNDLLALGQADTEREHAIERQLARCVRVWHEDNDTGGFFLAKFQYKCDQDETGVAKLFQTHPQTNLHTRPLRTKGLYSPDANSVLPADPELAHHISEIYGIDFSPYALWQRGKRLNISPPLVKTRLYDPPTPTNKHDSWPGGMFHPLRVVHAGLPAFTLKKDSWRSRQESTYVLAQDFTANITDISQEIFSEILCGWSPYVDEFLNASQHVSIPNGATILRACFPWGEELLSVWVGARITLMIDIFEQDILRFKLGLAWRGDEEE